MRLLAPFRSAALVASFLCVLAAPRVAAAEPSAQEQAQATELFDRALTAYKALQYANALPLFQSSQDIAPSVGALMYLGECHVQLQHFASAWGSFKEAARLGTQLGDKRVVSANARAAAIEKKVSYLTVTVGAAARVPDATVQVDGKPLPSAVWGTAMPRDAGTVAVALTAPGFEALKKSVTVAPDGARASVTFDEKPAEKSAPKTAAAPPPPKPAEVVPPPVEAPPPPASNTLRTVGWVSVGVGGVVAVAGGIVGFRALGKANDLRDQRIDFQSQKTPYTAGMVMLGVGGAVAVTGVALVLTHPSTSNVALRADPAAGTVELFGRF